MDPWQSDGDEEEDGEIEAAEEQDPMRGGRAHAWVNDGEDSHLRGEEERREGNVDKTPTIMQENKVITTCRQK